MSVEIVALYGMSLCLLMPLVSSMLVAVVNLADHCPLLGLGLGLGLRLEISRPCILWWTMTISYMGICYSRP